MDDLISRRAAIDGFYEMASDIDRLCTVGDYISFLESLSAQPEIIRCKDCKYWSEYEYINGKLESFPWCELDMTFSKEDDFCSRAERRTDG